MLWLALHCPTRPAVDDAAASSPDGSPSGDGFPTHALACWAGRFTSQVNLAPAALRLEIAGSLRLFGGLPAVLRLVREDLAALEIDAQLAVAATPLAALWLARAGTSDANAAVCTDLPATRAALAAVPLAALELPPPLARRIEGFGLRRLGDLLALPRASLGARLGKPFLVDLARAMGEVADPQVFFVFPERFEQGLELPCPGRGRAGAAVRRAAPGCGTGRLAGGEECRGARDRVADRPRPRCGHLVAAGLQRAGASGRCASSACSRKGWMRCRCRRRRWPCTFASVKSSRAMHAAMSCSMVRGSA
jgi:hypothetical protein